MLFFQAIEKKGQKENQAANKVTAGKLAIRRIADKKEGNNLHGKSDEFHLAVPSKSNLFCLIVTKILFFVKWLQG